MPFGSRKDRHAVIGGGEIGIEALLNVMRHPKLKDLPFYLETPLDDAGHKEEIARLRSCLGGQTDGKELLRRYLQAIDCTEDKFYHRYSSEEIKTGGYVFNMSHTSCFKNSFFAIMHIAKERRIYL